TQRKNKENERKMSKPEEKHLEQLLLQLDKVPRPQLQQKFTAHFKKSQKQQQTISLEDFASYFLSTLRHHTKQYFFTRNSKTPIQSLTPIRQVRPPAKDELKDMEAEQQLVLNESFFNRSGNSTSTPTRQPQPQQSRRSMPGGSGNFSSTPQNRSSGGGAGGGGGASAGHSFCLGDFMVQSPPNQSQHQRSKKKTTPQQNQASGGGGGGAATPQSKPRRRVLPMTISKNVSASSSFGDTSSFSNDNNLWRLSQSSELFDRSQGAALDLEERKSLLLNKQEIKNEAPVNLSQQQVQQEDELMLPLETLSLKDVPNTNQLQLLSTIYGLLMDLNLVPNVLSELSFVLQLLSIRNWEQSPEEATASKDALERLSDYKSCMYFSVKLLENQQKLLLQLDRKSLGVLLQNERLSLLPQNFIQQLEMSCQQKQEFMRVEAHPPPSSSAKQNVYYHGEKDSRDNFPSQNEFGAFKSQRDLFYQTLKQWELRHLSRVFNFTNEVTPRIREIFMVSDHPVNMAHFAKLFVSQLLISATETAESPEELGLKLDPLRLNRLTQRLVTSNSSVEGQFPRSQAFFRDFIAECSSLAFLVQLKMALFLQLMRHNDSTFELLQLAEDVDQEQGPYIVRIQTIANMLILAKFLGYLMVLPFSGSTQHGVSSPLQLCPQQLQLRSHFQPEFNLHEILERSMREGKILITLPWLVQYLVMLDWVSLQLPDAVSTLELIYSLYASLKTEKMQPGPVFITRSCIGWLIDAQPQLVSGYYSHRKMDTGASSTSAIVEQCLSGLRGQESSFAPLLEEFLPIACPYLQEFRVSITPSKQTTSRRMRYITTRLEQLQQSTSSTLSKEVASGELNHAEQQQRKLTEAFLHSQNASTRRLIEFVTERSFKCVVKDAQQEILLPSKASADAKVNEIISLQQGEVHQQLQQIFQQARDQACHQWNEQVPQMLDRRIKASLQSLLPASTNEVLRSTYAHLIRNQAQVQLQQWLQSSVLQSSFYHGDLRELATKVCTSNRNKADGEGVVAGGSSELQISPDIGFSLSELLLQLQQWMHCISMRPENVGSQKELGELLLQTQKAVLLPQLPTVFYHLIGSGLVHLLQLLITRRQELFNQEVISASCVVWRSPQFLASEASPGIFDGLLSVSFIEELGRNIGNFRFLEQLLQTMLQTKAVRADHLNELFMPLFRENWPPNVWSTLSNLLQQLSLSGGAGAVAEGEGTHDISFAGDSPEDEAKSHLFMEMLADLSRDLDSF
ncbi:hypothetical protein KR009_010197, partial [Drosophila setifemur]